MRRVAEVLVVALMAAAVLQLVPPPRASAQSGFELVDAYWTAPPAPGSTDVLRVVVKYTGSSAASGLTASMQLLNVAGTTLTATDSYAGDIGSGVCVYLDFNFSIPSGAKASYYEGVLTLSYTVNSASTSQTIKFQVGFQGQPSFSISASTSSLVRGSVNSLTITVKVQNAPARNVEIRVSPASAFVNVIGGNAVREGIVEAGTEISVPLKVSVDSHAGDSVALTVTVTCEDFSRAAVSSTQTIGFSTKGYAPAMFSASLSPTRVISGRPSTVYLSITNVGQGYARNVYVTVSPSAAAIAVLSGSSYNLGDMAPGATKRYPLLIRADRSFAGTASLTITISYTDEGGDSKTNVVTVGLEVERGPIPVVAVLPLNDTLPLGEETYIGINVTNIGSEPAENLVVDLVSAEGFMVLSESRFLIDKLNPGDSRVLRTKVFASPTIGDSAVMNVKLRYDDPYGSEYSDAVNVAFRVEKFGEAMLILESLNTTLRPNEVNLVLIRVVNVGTGPAYNVTVNLAPQSGEIGSVIGETERFIGRIDANSSVTVAYQIFVQPKLYGAVQLLASLSYKDKWGLKHSRILGVGYRVKGDWKISVVQVSTVPPILFPGDKNVRVFVTIANTGDYMARNINITFVGGRWIKPSTVSSATAYIPYLPVGGHLALAFLVDIDEATPPGNHMVYLLANGSHIAFQLTTLEKARFEVGNATKLAMYPGQRGYKLVLYVWNKGNESVDDVRVSLYSPFLTGTTSVRIGSMNPGDKTLVVFEVDLDETAPIGPLPVDVSISWTQDKRSLSQTSKVYIEVYARKRPWVLYAGGAAAAVVLAALYAARKYGAAALIASLSSRLGGLAEKTRKLVRRGGGK